MVQIQRNTSSWRSSDDLADMDFTQAAAELLGSNLDLSDDMALIGMENLFDDVDAVITEDRDIFMGCTEDTQLKNDIFMNCDTGQGALCYNELSPELSPETAAYDDVTSPLHSSSDESQDQASYSGGLTPDSDIMDSDIMDTEEQVCDESVIPLVALEITGAISPLKDTKRPTRRKAATKAGGVRKRRSPVKRPTKTVRARGGRKRQTEPDVQCVKVCPPTSEKSNTFSPSTLFPTIMSALRTNPTNAVPLERLVKPKTIDMVSTTNPDISGIQTPPTTPVELKPSVMIGSPLEDCLAKHEAQDLHDDINPSPKVSKSHSAAQIMPLVNDSEVKDTAEISIKSETGNEQVNTQTQEESSEMKDSEMEVVLNSVVEMSTQSGSLTVQNEENTLKETVSQNDQQCATNTSPKPRLKVGVRVPSPTRMTTRGITRRRPSLALKTKNELRSSKTGQNLPSKKVAQTVETPVDQSKLSQKEAVVSASIQCTSSITTGQCKTLTSGEALPPPVQTRTLTVSNSMLCSKTLPLAKGTSVTVVSSTARLGQPSVTAHPPVHAEHLPLPAKITAVPLTAIPARSTILGILPSTTRIRPAVAQSAPFKLQTVTASVQQLQTVTVPAQMVTTPAQQLQAVTAPAQLQTTPAAALPGATPVRLKPQPSASVSHPPTPAVSTIQASAAVLPKPITSTVQSVPPAQQLNVPISLPQVIPMSIKQELDSDSNDAEEKEASVASRNTEILNLLNKQTNLSCVKMEEDSLPRSYSGYSSSSSSCSSSGSPAPPQSPIYCSAPTPAVVSIKEEMLSDYSDIEDDYERFKNLSPEEQARVRRRRLNNRVAAQRCRQRKRDHFQGLKKEIQEWECSNTQLRYEIHVLQKELKSLAKVWNDHTTQCATAMAMTKRKHKKHKKSHCTASAASSSPSCSQSAAAASSTTTTSDPSPAPVPIVVN